MLLGTHFPRLDEKGRLFLPAKLRDDLAEGVVITRGQERCLYVFPEAEFAQVAERIRQAPTTDARVRSFGRMLFAGASNEAPDKQGRITIPQQLRDYASLDKDCVVIGAFTRLEIWDAPAWERYLAENEESYSAVSEEVLPGLL